VGFNCAACHVAELTYRGKRVRIDGAPGLVDLQGYQIEFKDSLDATLKSPERLVALVVAMEKGQNLSGTPTGEGGGQYASEPEVQTAGNVQPKPNADSSFHSISSAAADAAQPARKPTFREQLSTDIAFLKARLAHIQNGKLLVDGTEPGPGRVDAF